MYIFPLLGIPAIIIGSIMAGKGLLWDTWHDDVGTGIKNFLIGVVVLLV